MMLAHRGRIARPIDAGNPQADRRRHDRPLAERVLHHLIQDLLDLELAHRLQIGAAAARLGNDPPVAVSQLADRLGAAGIDADHVEGGPSEIYSIGSGVHVVHRFMRFGFTG